MSNEQDDPAQNWRTYFARFGPRLILFARQWLPDFSDAEDVVQEAFVRFWRKYQTPDDHHAGLLFAAVRSVALDHIRRETRRKRRETAASDDESASLGLPDASPFFEAATAGGTAPVEAALRQLPDEQRQVLVLKIWGELTFAQIAEALKLSPNTAASRYRYAISALKKIIRPVYHE